MSGDIRSLPDVRGECFVLLVRSNDSTWYDWFTDNFESAVCELWSSHERFSGGAKSRLSSVAAMIDERNRRGAFGKSQ